MYILFFRLWQREEEKEKERENKKKTHCYIKCIIEG